MESFYFVVVYIILMPMGFYEWLKEKLKFQLITLGILTGAMVFAYLLEHRVKKNVSFRYSDLPDKCYCRNCGYVLENPGKHCADIRCPKCGARMWRTP